MSKFGGDSITPCDILKGEDMGELNTIECSIKCSSRENCGWFAMLQPFGYGSPKDLCILQNGSGMNNMRVINPSDRLQLFSMHSNTCFGNN